MDVCNDLTTNGSENEWNNGTERERLNTKTRTFSTMEKYYPARAKYNPANANAFNAFVFWLNSDKRCALFVRIQSNASIPTLFKYLQWTDWAINETITNFDCDRHWFDLVVFIANAFRSQFTEPNAFRYQHKCSVHYKCTRNALGTYISRQVPG